MNEGVRREREEITNEILRALGNCDCGLVKKPEGIPSVCALNPYSPQVMNIYRAFNLWGMVSVKRKCSRSTRKACSGCERSGIFLANPPDWTRLQYSESCFFLFWCRYVFRSLP